MLAVWLGICSLLRAPQSTQPTASNEASAPRVPTTLHAAPHAAPSAVPSAAPHAAPNTAPNEVPNALQRQNAQGDTSGRPRHSKSRSRSRSRRRARPRPRSRSRDRHRGARPASRERGRPRSRQRHPHATSSRYHDRRSPSPATPRHRPQDHGDHGRGRSSVHAGPMGPVGPSGPGLWALLNPHGQAIPLTDEEVRAIFRYRAEESRKLYQQMTDQCAAAAQYAAQFAPQPLSVPNPMPPSGAPAAMGWTYPSHGVRGDDRSHYSYSHPPAMGTQGKRPYAYH